jgi:hypothetical protein
MEFEIILSAYNYLQFSEVLFNAIDARYSVKFQDCYRDDLKSSDWY